MSSTTPNLYAGQSITWLRWRRRLRSPVLWQGLAGIVIFFLVWQLTRWIGWLTLMPGPVELAAGLPDEIAKPNYWWSWVSSSQRVFGGFLLAALLGMTMGILMGMSKKGRFMAFPVMEIMRPIPPLAWLPLAILFWPSAEMTMIFLTFIGAFFPILLNVLAGIDNIDQRYIQGAMSLGASRRSMFRDVLWPGALPAVFTGLAIAIGITWEVVIAAEMASGSDGLGYLTWDSYMSHSMTGIVLGMLSIGVAGMVSAWAVKRIGKWLTPWQSRI